jgi:hypothetical protein
MGLDGQHVAKLGDWIDLETLSIPDNDCLKPLAGTKMNCCRVTQIGLDPEHLVLVIDSGADANIQWTALGRGLGMEQGRDQKRQQQRGEEFHGLQFSRVSASTR